MLPQDTTSLTDTEWNDIGVWLKSMLNKHTVTVVFTKKDGSERKMLCTTNESFLPPKKEVAESKARKEKQGVVPVYDLEKQEWRSFTLKSVKSVSFDLKEAK